MAHSHPLETADRLPMDWDGIVRGTSAPDLASPALTKDSAERDARGYTLHGKFASRNHLAVHQHERDCMRDEPEPAVIWPRWHSIAAFLFISMGTIFSLCALGRPGA